jgi:dephospho-CoA kinase
MPLAETEENAIRQERQQSAAERRNRNARAIAEVVGRNPVKRQQLDSYSHPHPRRYHY